MPRRKPITGETPLDDPSGLRLKKLRARRQLNIAEADNIRLAILKYLAAKPSARQAPFDLRWLKTLHKEMFGRVWTWAGTFRTRQLNIGVPAAQVESQLHNLLLDLEHWEKSPLPLIEQSTLLHHRSVAIHPFLNGNGRWARLLANIWLKMHDHPLTEWPESTIGDESIIRKEYLVAIRAADRGDLAPLLLLHQRFTSPS